MRVRLRSKTAVAVGGIIGCLFILLGVLLVIWIDHRSSSSCPGESATSFALGTDETWCTPKSEFCEMLRRNLDEGGSEDDKTTFRHICAEFEELEE